MLRLFLYITNDFLGMLSSAETIDVIAETLQAHKVPVIVLDPVCPISCYPNYHSNQYQQVMVSTSGSQLLPEKAVKELRTKLLPLATILTPNIPEALLLLKDAGAETSEPKDLEGMVELAKKICSLGPKAVLLKGGHLPLTKDHKTSQTPNEGTLVVDILFDGTTATLFETEFLVSKNTHGTGCSLASAIAANLASGKDMIRAVRSAVRFVEVGIKTSIDLGKGSGPINHFHSTYTMPFAPYVTHPLDILVFFILTVCYLAVDSLSTSWTAMMCIKYGSSLPTMSLSKAWARVRYLLEGSRRTSCKTISTW
jgi:Hydroxymethylpyrimidine/phosphomethylpyrimidine kinase